MKKFLAVFDGYKMSKSTMEYGIQLTQAANAHPVGVFLDEFISRSYSVYKVVTNYKNYEIFPLILFVPETLVAKMY